MTPQELLAAAEAGTLDMDSEDPQIKEPAPQQQDATPAEAGQNQAPEGAEVVAPIASKSGAYTIPYEQLAKAREQAKAFAAEAEMLRAQLQSCPLRKPPTWQQPKRRLKTEWMPVKQQRNRMQTWPQRSRP